MSRLEGMDHPGVAESGRPQEAPSPSQRADMFAIQRALDFIAHATEALKGPMSNLERALMVADRKDARAFLASIDGSAEGVAARQLRADP